jgi:spermidine synthase
MALQISYKWNIPYVKTILRWHVEFGIGLAATGILHFIWHLSYFGKLLSEESKDAIATSEKIDNGSGSEGIGANLFVIGFVSSSIQFLLIREMLNIAGGYELITGIFLGTWLFLSSVGAAFAGKSGQIDTGRINLIFALSPIISILLMLFMVRLFLGNGETPSVLVSMIYTLIVLIPFCISSGFIFVKLLSAAKKTSDGNSGKSFSIETTGGIIAGLLISLLVSNDLGTYKLLLVIILLSVTYALLTYYISKNIARLITKVLVTIAVTVIVISDPDIIFRQIMLPSIIVTESRDTPYGNVTTGNYRNEKSVYYNHRLISYNDDVIEREEDIHYAMLQHNAPQNILVISGSFVSHIPEILKYPIDKIVYIERDPALAMKEYADSLKEKVLVANTDALSYIRKTQEKNDVIIMLVPPPTNLLLNRYYTKEFFADIKKTLEIGGVFLCSPGAGENYYNDESLDLNSSIFNSLKSVFRNVIPVAGNKLYFIASDNTLSNEFCKLTVIRKISNLYVSSDYLSDDLTVIKSIEINKLLDPSVELNSAGHPLAYSYLQSYYLSENRNEKWVLLLLFFGLFAYTLYTVSRPNLTMYFSASALAGFEIISLLTVQMTVGNMYQMTGLIIAGLMAGLAVGSGFSFRIFSKISMPLKGIFMACFYISSGLFYNYILQSENRITVTILILILTFIPAFITGNIFRELTCSNHEQYNSAKVYSADLSGSAMGFIAVAGFTIPTLGIIVTLYFLGGLVFTGILFGTILNKH